MVLTDGHAGAAAPAYVSRNEIAERPSSGSSCLPRNDSSATQAAGLPRLPSQSATSFAPADRTNLLGKAVIANYLTRMAMQWSLGNELTGTATKKARGRGHTPTEVVQDFVRDHNHVARPTPQRGHHRRGPLVDVCLVVLVSGSSVGLLAGGLLTLVLARLCT